MTSTEAVARVRRITEAAQGRPWRHPRSAGDRRAADRARRGDQDRRLRRWTGASTTASPPARARRARTDDRRGRGHGATSARAARAPPRSRRRCRRFVGTIEQVPPRFAAVKVEGERAYDLARRGEAVELAARPVEVDGFALVERPDPDHVDLRGGVRPRHLRACAGARSRRSSLGCLGHVVALRRLQVGPFRAEGAISLDGARAAGRRRRPAAGAAAGAARRSASCRRWR